MCIWEIATLKKKFSAFNLSPSHFQHRVAVLENLSLFHSQLPSKTSHTHSAVFSWSYSFFTARSSLHFKYKSSCLSGLQYFPAICGLRPMSRGYGEMPSEPNQNFTSGSLGKVRRTTSILSLTTVLQSQSRVGRQYYICLLWNIDSTLYRTICKPGSNMSFLVNCS